MEEQEHAEHSEQTAEVSHGRTPLVFPAGDLDDLIFHGEYWVDHSGR